MAALRELLLDLAINVDDARLKQADKEIRRFKDALKSTAVFAATVFAGRALAGVVKENIAIADSVDKVAGKLGITTDLLQEYQYAGQLTGVAQNAMNMGLQRFIRRTAEAAKGQGEAKDTLKQYHIQVKNADGTLRDSALVLNDVADAIQGATSEQEKLRIAFKLFDSEGVAMVNTLKGGSAQLTQMRDEIHELGGVMSKEMIEQSVKATDNLYRMDRALFGIKTQLTVIFVPWINRAAEAMIKFIKYVRESPRVIAFLKIALIALSTLLGITMVGSMIKLGKALLPLLIRFAPLIATTLLWAVGITALVLIIEDLWVALNGGNSVLGPLLETFDEWIEKIDQITQYIPGIGQLAHGLREIGKFVGNAGGMTEEESFAQQQQFLAEARTKNAARRRAAGLLGTKGNRVQKGETRQQAIERIASRVVTGGGGGRAVVASPSGGGTTNVNQRIEAPMTINAPGGDVGKIKKEIERHMGKVFKDAGAMLPQLAGT